MTDQNNAPSSAASDDVATVHEWIKRTRLSYKTHGPADAMERILIRTTVTAVTLRTLLDNLVIAQSLSKEVRSRATDEARSYLYNTRKAAPAPSSLAGGEVERAARLIDPKAWEFADKFSTGPHAEMMRAEVKCETAASLRIAGEVLAALSPEAPARDGVDTVSVLVMAVQDAELAFRKTQSMADISRVDLGKYAALQSAIKAAVVAVGGKWK